MSEILHHALLPKEIYEFRLWDTVSLSPHTIANKIRMFAEPMSKKKPMGKTNLREPHLLTAGTEFMVDDIQFNQMKGYKIIPPPWQNSIMMNGSWQIQLYETIHTDLSLLTVGLNYTNLHPYPPIIRADIPFSVNLVFRNLPFDFKPFELQCVLNGKLLRESKK